MKQVTDPLELLDIFGGSLPSFKEVQISLAKDNKETTLSVYQTAEEFLQDSNY